jgi:methyl-accepting chemotaxis protein
MPWLALTRNQLLIGCALATLAVFRLIPGNVLQGLDGLLGRAGDTSLLVVATLLVAALFKVPTPSAAAPLGTSQTPAADPLQDLMDTHLALDQAIDQKLQEVVIDTENSALAIIGQVRGLYDSANTLVTYLEHSSPQANSLGSDIIDSVSYLVQVGAFIQELPEKMTRDLSSVQSLVQEITELSSLVGSVHAISMQSHLLAINAAIEGSRAGPAGAAFRVVADEMRLLAKNSSEVALKINQGLVRARAVVEGGMSTRIAESNKALSDASQAVGSIQKLQENFEDMSQYFKTRFAVITQHNQNLAKDIAEVLGHIQYQDVVSQCIGRIRLTTTKRNEFLQSTFASLDDTDADLSNLSPLLTLILNDFLAEEDKHKHSARHDEQTNGELKFELF